MADLAFLVDTTKCIGCKACQAACKQWNNLPPEKTDSLQSAEFTNPKELSAVTFNHVKFFKLDNSNSSPPVWQFMHKKCYHCELPNCLTICPVKAVSKYNGWVVINQEICIGCGSCVEACVYNVPHLADKKFAEYGSGRFVKKGKSYKCHGCTVYEREIPACVKTCPTDALTMGFRVTILHRADKRLKLVKKEFPNASVYGKFEFEGLHVITILKDRPERFGLPVNPKPVK